MAIRETLKMGHSLLWQTARPVEDFGSPELDALIADMFETMQALNGVGLAAPQIGESLHLIVFEVRDNPRYPEAAAIPRTVLVNPALRVIDQTQEEDWEGCLSLPGLRGRVPRYRAVHYQGRDAQGRVLEGEARGFHARLLQHEVDHLDGILYPQRIRDLRNFGFESALFAPPPAPEKTTRES
ncbi:MAG TPA: peptide deformylase [Gammaproteobacteria bacterium]|nr:peptide deformylase [Gammaproteobacteria bacterium]